MISSFPTKADFIGSSTSSARRRPSEESESITIREGEIYLVREPHSALPGDYQCELYFMGVLANAGIVQTSGRPLTPADEFWLRVGVQGGKIEFGGLSFQVGVRYTF